MANGSDDEKDFNWLRRTSRGDSYVSYSAFSGLSACSFEFGHCGYAACCNYGGQLLQLSAPSRRGVSFVKGAFSESLYASLARAQRDNGGQCTFGIEVATDLSPCEPSTQSCGKPSTQSCGKPSTQSCGEPPPCRKPSQFRLGNMLERGCFNYRWPLHEYSLVHKKEATGDCNWPLKNEKEIGTCVMFSFIKGGTLYQVMRLDQRHGSEHAPEGEIRLTLGGILQFNHYNSDTSAAGDEEEKRETGVGKPQSGEEANVATNTDQSEEERNFEIGEFPSECLKVMDKNRNIIFQARLYQYVSGEGRNSYDDIELCKSVEKKDRGITHKLDRNGWAACHAHCPLFPRAGQRGRQEGNQAAVFVAAFRIIEGTKLPSELWKPDMPDSSAIRRYIGANPDNKSSATGFMWDTIFFKHYLPRNPLYQIAEIRLLGRTIEKILHVDMMPAKFPSWKVRFLVKVYAFLGSCTNDDVSNEKYTDAPEGAGEEDTCDLTQPKDLTASPGTRIGAIAKYQRCCIRTGLEGVIRFLIQQLSNCRSSLFEKDTEDSEDSKDTDRSSIYYVMMTLWYVVKHEASFTWVMSRLKAEANIPYLSEIYPDHEMFGIENKEKIPFLQWYHYGSIQKLYGATLPIPGLEHKVIQLERAALNVAAGKLSSKRPYSANDEIIDRLSFLAHELGLETIDHRRGSVASLAARRVSGRDFTRYLNPGPLESDEEGFTDGIPDGPWEVHALCHHSRLVVSCQESYNIRDWRTVDQRAEEANLYKEKICQFLNSEATLVACWERSNLKARKGLIQSEASSVFGSTLLDIYRKDLEDEQHEDRSAVASKELKRVVQELLPMKTLMAQQLKTLELHMPEAGPAPPIEWTETWRPPRQYHPDKFLESLDDTPDLYRREHLKNVTIDPSLDGYVTEPGCQDFTKDGLRVLNELNWVRVADIIDAKGDNIKNELVVIDASKDSEPVLPVDNPKKPTDDVLDTLVKRLHDSLVDLDVRHRFLLVKSPIKEELQNNKSKLPDNEKEELQRKKDLLDTLVYVLCPHSASCLSNHLLNLSRFSFQNRNDWVARITLVSWEVIEDDVDMSDKTPSRRRIGGFRQKKGIHAEPQKCGAASVFNWMRARLFPGLSGIKKGIKGSASPSTVDDTTPRSPSNSENRDIEKAMDPSSTSKKSASPSTPDHIPQKARSSEPPREKDHDFRNRMDLAPIFVPHNLQSVIKGMKSDEEKLQPDEEKSQSDEQKKKKEEEKKKYRDELPRNIFKPRVSSFVLATNGFGDFSKCTIISQLLTTEDLKDKIAEKAEKLWRQFVHQPQTGRCLVFLQVLKVITRNMIEQYREALTRLLSVSDLDDYLSQEVKKWSEDSNAERLFQLRLWSLEALYQFQRPLKPSIESIKEAKEELFAQVKDGPGRRSEQLEKSCQRYLDSFESCFAELMAVAGDLERVIELNSRNKDAFEAILALADSRASLAQNRTIERLTYLTIIYLPIGLMAAIFAIPETHNVVFQPMGRGWFIGSILIMLLATAVLAYYVKNFLDFVKNPRKWLEERKKKPGRESIGVVQTLDHGKIPPS